MERSIVNARPVELTRAEDGRTTIKGYGAVFYRDDDQGTEFELWPGLVERIMPGAFDKVIDGADVRSMFNHDPNQILGRTKNRTLRLSVDSVGLRYEVDLPDTQTGRDIARSVERGDVDGSSFWFQIADGGTTKRKDGDQEIWEIRELSNLLEVGPVTMPAYKATSAAMRSMLQKYHDECQRWRRQSDIDADIARALGIDIAEPRL